MMARATSLFVLWVSSIVAASLGGYAAAFVPSSSSRARRLAVAPILRLRASNEQNCHAHGEEGSGITRRELFRSSAAVGAASLVKPTSALAATETATKKSRPSTVVSNTLCDHSVSTWTKLHDNDMRTVHLLGTAHISADSAALAGRMVREIKPDVVFVELDAKRVARAVPGGIKGGSVASSGASVASSDASPAVTNESSPASAFTSTPSNAPTSPKTNPFDVQSKLVNAGSKVVGNSVKSMYGKLESEGFKAGDEFAMSVKEGLAIGSTVVLGDRDVEVTLRRLTQALAKTDIRKLLSADSEVERSMEELLPEGMKQQLKQSSVNGGSSGGDSMSVTSMGMEDVSISKQEFTTFVETMKAKENVKAIMSALKKTAPEIYEAMVAERDVYMGEGLDELGYSLKDQDRRADSTVAVVGMAHVDGIERYLMSKGWKEMSYPCPAVR